MNLKAIITNIVTSLALLAGFLAAAPAYAETFRPAAEDRSVNAATASSYSLTSDFIERKGREFMTGLKSLLHGGRLHISGMPMGLADAYDINSGVEDGSVSGVVDSRRYFAYKTDIFGVKMAYDFKYSNTRDKSSGIEPIDILTLLPGSASDKHVIMAELRFNL